MNGITFVATGILVGLAPQNKALSPPKLKYRTLYINGVSIILSMSSPLHKSRRRDAYYEQLIAGKVPNQKLLKYIKRDERILNIVKHFD